MTPTSTEERDHQTEQLIGRLLQFGVLAAGVVVLLGGIGLVIQHGNAPLQLSEFQGQPEYLRSLRGIFRGVSRLDSMATVQLGLVMLIATPIARVALTLIAFVIQRDRTYVMITAVVLVLLLFGLISGRG